MHSSRFRAAGARKVWWALAGLLCSGPALAQAAQDVPASVRGARHPRWVTGLAIGPSLVMGPARGPLQDGFDLATTVEYTFDRPGRLWLRATLDANQFSAIETLAGPGYGYELKINHTATAVLLAAGYRRSFGRLAPFVFAGAGGAYVSSSQLTGQQNGQAQRAGTESRYAFAAHGGAGLEYRLLQSGAIPYTELTMLALPAQRVAGKRFVCLTPLAGVKFPF